MLYFSVATFSLEMWDTPWCVLRRKKALLHFLLCLHSLHLWDMAQVVTEVNEQPWYINILCQYYVVLWLASRCEEYKCFSWCLTTKKREMLGFYLHRHWKGSSSCGCSGRFEVSLVCSAGAHSSLMGHEHSLLCLVHGKCSPKLAAPGAENQTDYYRISVPFSQDFLCQWV